MKKNISLSPSIIWWAVGIVLGLWFLYVIRDVIVLFFVAVVLSAAIEPAVRRITRKKIPRAAAVSLIYLLLLVVFGLLLSYLIPTVIVQTQNIFHMFPEYVRQLSGSFSGIGDVLETIFRRDNNTTSAVSAEGVSWLTKGLFSTTLGLFSGVISLIAVFSIAFYMSIVDDGVARFLRSVTPKRYQEYVIGRVMIVYERIGYWMLGQLVLMILVFTLYYIVLSLLGIPNALLLSLLGGLLEIIPYIGPTLAVIPSAILGFTTSPLVGILVIASYILIQQIENHVLVPQIMKRAIGLHPIVIILVLLAGAKVAGPLGMILAIPLATAVNVFIKDVSDWREKETNLLSNESAV